MSPRWVALYAVFCLAQIPLYYHLGSAPLGFDFAVKRAEVQLARPQPDYEAVQEALAQAEGYQKDMSPLDSRRGRYHLSAASLAWAQGQMAEAERHFRASYDIFLRSHGPDAWHTSAVNLRYAEFLTYGRRFEEALERFELGTRAIDEVQGPDSPFALRMKCRTLMVLFHLGRVRESAQLAQQILPPLQEQAHLFDELLLRQVAGTFDALSKQKLLPEAKPHGWSEKLLAAARVARERAEESPPAE